MRKFVLWVISISVTLGMLMAGCLKKKSDESADAGQPDNKMVEIVAVAEIDPAMLPEEESLADVAGDVQLAADTDSVSTSVLGLTAREIATLQRKRDAANARRQADMEREAEVAMAEHDRRFGSSRLKEPLWSRKVSGGISSRGAVSEDFSAMAPSAEAIIELESASAKAVPQKLIDGEASVTGPASGAQSAEVTVAAESEEAKSAPEVTENGEDHKLAALDAPAADIDNDCLLPPPFLTENEFASDDKAAEKSATAAVEDTIEDVPGLVPVPEADETVFEQELGDESAAISVADDADESSAIVDLVEKSIKSDAGADAAPADATLEMTSMSEVVSGGKGESDVAVAADAALEAVSNTESSGDESSALAAPALALDGENPTAEDLTKKSTADERIDAVASRAKIAAEEKRIAAEAQYQKGLELYRNQAYADALKSFEQAALLNPDLKEAGDYRDRCRRLLGVPGGDEAGRLLSEVVNRERTRLLAVEAQIKSDIDSAEKLYIAATGPQSGDLDALEQAAKSSRDLESAMQKLREVDSLLGTSTLQAASHKNLRLRVQALRAQVLEASDKVNKTREEIERRLALDQKEGRQQETRDIHVKRVQNLLSTAQFYFDRKEYDKSEELCDQVMRIDPGNPTAFELRNKSRSAYHSHTNRENRTMLHDAEVNWSLDVGKAAIMPSDDLLYPEDWEQIKRRVARRSEDSGVSQGERRILERLDSTRISAEYHENPLADVLREIAEQGNINIIVDPQIDAEEITIDHFGVRDMTLSKVLDWIMTLTNLKYKVEDEAIFVRPSDATGERVVLQLYPVADLTRGMRNYDPPVGDDEEEEEEDEEGMEGATVENLPEQIQRFVQPESWETADRSIDMWQDNLLVMQTPEVHSQILNYLNRLREASKQQVLIEGRFLNVSENFLEHIGFEWSGDSETATGNSFASIPEGISATRETDYTTGLGFRPGTGALSTNDHGGLALNYEAIKGTMGGFLGDIFDNASMNATLTAVQENKQGSVLHAPKVLVANGKNAYTRIVTETHYVETWTEQGDEYEPEIKTYDQGVTWNVRPVVSFDRKYITIRLRPRMTRLVEITTVPLELTAENEETGQISEFSFNLTLPQVRVVQLESFATIPDGGTILMGGFIEDNRSENLSATPFVSDIPVVGRLFSSENHSREKSNLVIMVHGKIVELDG